MKAAELRIGNWVNLYGDDCRIQTVGMWVHTDTTVDEAPIESVKPIPLTEEWLLKFGFQFVAAWNNWALLTGNKGRIHFSVDTNRKLYYKDGHYRRIYLESVHQLQNLYFALTGTELTLNQKDNHDQRPEG